MPEHRVLIITREAPPSIGPHPIRVAKLAKYLPSFGWKPTILTVPHDHAWAHDPDLLQDIVSAQVVEVPRLFSRVSHPTGANAGDAGLRPNVPPRRIRLRQRLGSLAIPDAGMTWAIPAARHAGAIAPSVDAILTTAPPFSTHLAGLWVARQEGTPWVAEYRDNWTVNPLYRRGVIRDVLDRWLEQRVLHGAARVVVVSDAAAAELAGAFPFVEDRVRVAENGYDPDDLPVASQVADHFTIAYMGSLDERRDPTAFLAAIQQAEVRHPGLVADLRLHLMGNIAGSVVAAAVARLGADRIRMDGLVTHRDALARASGAAVLLGITTKMEAGGAGMTSKLFEYLGLRRPILMLAPEGPAAELVTSLGAGIAVPPDDVPAIATALGQLYEDWLGGRQRIAGHDRLQRFTRLQTARHVAAALDEAIGTSR